MRFTHHSHRHRPVYGFWPRPMRWPVRFSLQLKGTAELWEDHTFKNEMRCMCVVTQADGGVRACNSLPTAKVNTPFGWASKCRSCLLPGDTPWVEP
jgi:hypothetical protein